MKKKKEVVKKKINKRGRILGLKEETFFGLEKNFIMIFGGGFLVIVLGVMIFY